MHLVACIRLSVNALTLKPLDLWPWFCAWIPESLMTSSVEMLRKQLRNMTVQIYNSGCFQSVCIFVYILLLQRELQLNMSNCSYLCSSLPVTVIWAEVHITHSDSMTKKNVLILRRFCVVSFCEFCVRFTQTMVFVCLGDVHNTVSSHKATIGPVDPLIFLEVQLYDMLYWCKATFCLYLGFLKTTQKLLKAINGFWPNGLEIIGFPVFCQMWKKKYSYSRFFNVFLPCGLIILREMESILWTSAKVITINFKQQFNYRIRKAGLGKDCSEKDLEWCLVDW